MLHITGEQKSHSVAFDDNVKGVVGYHQPVVGVSRAGRINTVDFDQNTAAGLRSHGTYFYRAADKSVDNHWRTSEYTCMEYIVKSKTLEHT